MEVVDFLVHAFMCDIRFLYNVFIYTNMLVIVCITL